MHLAVSGIQNPEHPEQNVQNMLVSEANMPGRDPPHLVLLMFHVSKLASALKHFSVTGPQTWNSLPVEMRNVPMTQSVFKNRLKTFLFEQAYPAFGQ